MGFKPTDTCPGYQEGNKRGHLETAMEYLEEFADLTPVNMTIVKAMIRGVFDCGHCEHYVINCATTFSAEKFANPPVESREWWPCDTWQEREDD